jgi:hypothetical protein
MRSRGLFFFCSSCLFLATTKREKNTTWVFFKGFICAIRILHPRVKNLMDTYLKRTISQPHDGFKVAMNDVFVTLLTQFIPGTKNVVYMDAASGETTRKLANLPHKRFVANNVSNVVAELKAAFADVHVESGYIHECLRSVWRNVMFQAAYFDSCSANAEKINEIFQCFFQRNFDTLTPIVIGYTIVGRCRGKKKGLTKEQAIDKRSQLNRTQEIAKCILDISISLKMQLKRASDLACFAGTTWLHDGIFTEFFVLEPLTKMVDIDVVINIQKQLVELGDVQKKMLDLHHVEAQKQTLLLQHIEDQRETQREIKSAQPQHVDAMIPIPQDGEFQASDALRLNNEAPQRTSPFVAVAFEITPISERKAGRCCIVGCARASKNARSTTCANHLKIKVLLDGRERTKRQYRKRKGGIQFQPRNKPAEILVPSATTAICTTKLDEFRSKMAERTLLHWLTPRSMLLD